MHRSDEKKWKLDPRNGRVLLRGDAKLATVASTPGDPAQAFRDAKLMVSAPELAECLRDLKDCQNGPPLIQYEAEWHDAMKRAAELLERVGE